MEYIDMEHIENDRRIGLDAIFFAVYLASSPIHQILLLPNGGTVTKYLAFAAMIACFLFGDVRRMKDSVAAPIQTIAIWFALSILWSRNRGGTISSLISIFSYFALFWIISSKTWSRREKELFIFAFLVVCVYFGFNLIRSASTMRRATIVSSETGIEADQNVLSANIGLGVLFALHVFLNSNHKIIRMCMIASVLVIVAGIVATGSRGALIALTAAMVYYAYSSAIISIKHRRTINFLLILSATLVIVALTRNLLGNDYVVSRYLESGTDTTNRTVIWGRYLEVLFHRPLGIIIGYGYGAGGLEYGDYFSTRWPPATHNDILSIIVSTGLIGLYFVYSLVKNVWGKSKENKNFLGNACMVLMITASLSVNIFDRYGWWNAIIFAAIGIGSVKTNEGSII